MLPENYKIQVTDYIEELWSVWRSLGVYSEGVVLPMAPEEAIIGLCVLGRYDQRLFDEALSFIIQYSRFISKNRLLSLVKKIDEDSKIVFHIVAAFLEKMSNDTRFTALFNHFNKLNEKSFFRSLQNRAFFTGKKEDHLFLQFGFKRNIFTKSDKLRNLKFVSDNNQWVKAKLVFGNTVRADTVMELICNKKCTGPTIAFNTGYTQKSIWNVLTDFESAGLVTGKKHFNRIIYCLSNAGEKQFSQFRIKKKPPDISRWIKSGHYLSAFIKLPQNASDLLIRSEEKRIDKVINDLRIVKEDL